MTAPEFFNSAIVSVPERLVLRGGAWGRIDIGVRYGLFMHAAHGPILIDTGYGPRATEAPGRSAMLKLYGAVLRPKLQRDQLPMSVLAQKGIRPEDVKLIILTHFHPDHIAALRDFPQARFRASGTAWQAITRMNSASRLRNAIFMELLPDDFATRLDPVEDSAPAQLPLGLGQGWDVLGDGSCLAVDLPGHALGHFGLVWPDGPAPSLYAVDTQWLGDAVARQRYPRGPATLVYADAGAMRVSAEKVRRFAESGGIVHFCHERVS